MKGFLEELELELGLEKGGLELIAAVVVTTIIVTVTAAIYVSQHWVGHIYIYNFTTPQNNSMRSALVLFYTL